MDNKVGTDGPAGLPAAQELLPCPFCGSPGEVVKSEHAYGFYGACDACGMCLCVRNTYMSAAKHWNRRAPQAAAPGGVAPTLTEAEFNRFLAICKNPPPPTEALKELVRKAPPWLKEQFAPTPSPSLVEENRRLREALLASIRTMVVVGGTVDGAGGDELSNAVLAARTALRSGDRG